ncbi:16 kDa heat shock protein A [hydrothermal vent metagenome]|uniref:16 kDa heat shock protein A n=1 Tax=hydrothermal vent metagenome TaxID=652676 RepID=A0A3B0T9H1_9ZZZZ
MQTFDFSPFYRSTVGFDRLFSTLDGLNVQETKSAYPPYNIERTGDDTYRISVAVAGFSKDEISIQTKENNLVIKGGKSEQENTEREFLHRGIAERAFDLRFQLADYVEVSSAIVENGLLHLELKRELPESKKPRQIQIGSTDEPQTIEKKSAAN